MDQLKTIQTTDVLNTVTFLEEPGPGGAYHEYVIERPSENDPVLATIHFQKGPRKVSDSEDGVMNEDLLEIVRHRLQCFQEGNFKF